VERWGGEGGNGEGELELMPRRFASCCCQVKVRTECDGEVGRGDDGDGEKKKRTSRGRLMTTWTVSPSRVGDAGFSTTRAVARWRGSMLSSAMGDGIARTRRETKRIRKREEGAQSDGSKGTVFFFFSFFYST
jgi:hypothetical protein